MKRRIAAGAFILACGLMLASCGLTDGHDALLEDHAGTALHEVEHMTLDEHYQRAGDRYVELNELFGELQLQISSDAWVDNGGRVEIVPGQGNTLGRAPKGTTRDNSYFFTVARWQETEQDLRVILEEVAESWRERGWDIERHSNPAFPDIRITATTENGYWFAIEEERRKHRVVLRGQSPVYWGPLDELQDAIVERAAAEEAAGQTWETDDRDGETDQAIRQPGEYRPFPAWDAAEGYSPEPSPAPEWRTRDEIDGRHSNAL